MTSFPGPESDDWSYEQRLFQAARFATEMQYQHLVFEEFARKVQPNVDPIVFNENSYDATVDPAVPAEFAHVVYRFGHSMLTEEIDRAGFGTESVSLLDGFLNPRTYDDDGALTPEQAAGAVVNGTTNQVAGQIDEHVIGTLRNNLLGLPLDLATINLLRGRDTGTPGLQDARRTFFATSGSPTLEPYESWYDFGVGLKNGNNFGRGGSNASLINFVAAYGAHPSILAATTVEAKRDAASLLVNGRSRPERGSCHASPVRRRAHGDDDQPVGVRHTGAGVPGSPSSTSRTEATSPMPSRAARRRCGRWADPAGRPRRSPRRRPQPSFRLRPQRIVVLGGEDAVSRRRVTDSRAYTRAVRSHGSSGADRYETAANISAAAFPTGRGRVYIASGEDFPDALAEATDRLSGRSTDPARGAERDRRHPTRAELDRLNPGKVVVLGGPPRSARRP